MVARTHAAGRHTMLVPLTALGDRTYTPYAGLTAHDSCWVLDRADGAGNIPPAAAN